MAADPNIMNKNKLSPRRIVARVILLTVVVGAALAFTSSVSAGSAYGFVNSIQEFFGMAASGTAPLAGTAAGNAPTAATAVSSDYFFNGALTAGDPIFVNPGGSTAGTGMHYYDVFQFTVGTTGPHTIETSSLNTNGAGMTSNALDTYIRLYAGSFDPMAPGGAVTFNDDFNGMLSVLPGPYTVDGLTNTATGFINAQPSSRLECQFDGGYTIFPRNDELPATDYVPSSTTQPEGGPTGPYWSGISPGDIIPTIPVLGNYPATMVDLSDNITITPDAAPTDTTSISVSAPTGFVGELTADPATGVVRVTNAHHAKIPAGAYTVTVKAFGPGGNRRRHLC